MSAANLVIALSLCYRGVQQIVGLHLLLLLCQLEGTFIVFLQERKLLQLADLTSQTVNMHLDACFNLLLFETLYY